MALRILQLMNHVPMTIPIKSVFGHANAGLSPRQCTQLMFSTRNSINRFHRRNVGLVNRPIVESGVSDASLSVLNKPILFTLGFSTSAFVGAAIWEYKNVRRQSDPMTLTAFIRDEASPGLRFFLPICALNLAVFGLWRLPRLKPIMSKLFMSNPTGRALCWPMFLSTFSHKSGLHLFVNMYALYSLSNIFCMSMGTEQATDVYLSAGVVANLASYAGKVVLGTGGASLGASGAIMAMFSYGCTRFPDSNLICLSIPSYNISIPALTVKMLFDVIGMAHGWKFFNHAAHLGGAFCGIFWCDVGQKKLWQAQRAISEKWDKFRTNE